MIKLVRTKLLKWYTVVPLSITLLVTSCYPDNSEAKRDFSGEEMFRGVFFLQGQVANNLETLKPFSNRLVNAIGDNQEAMNYHNEFVNEMIHQIKTIDPNYFDQFKSQMQSQNYYAIDLALNNGRKMLKVAGYQSKYASMFNLVDEMREKKVDFSSEDLKNLDLSKEADQAKLKTVLKNTYDIDLNDEDYKVACIPVIAICVAIVLVVDIAAAVHHALAVYIWEAAAVVHQWVEAWGGTTSGGNLQDALVSDIAATL